MRISDWSSDVCSSDLPSLRAPSRSGNPPPNAADLERLCFLRRPYCTKRKYISTSSACEPVHGSPMITIALDPAHLSIALVGRGDLAVRRFGPLRAGGATAMTVYSDALRPLQVQARKSPRLTTSHY